jgi:hypothetical protein
MVVLWDRVSSCARNKIMLMKHMRCSERPNHYLVIWMSFGMA